MCYKLCPTRNRVSEYENIFTVINRWFVARILWKLYCSGNALKELDLSNNTKMENLYCKQPLFGHIDIIRPANNPELGLGTSSFWTDGLTLIWFEEANKN